MEWQTRVGYHSWCGYRDPQCVIVVVVPTTLTFCPTGARPFCAWTPTQYNIIYFTQVHCDQPSSPFYTTAKAEILRQIDRILCIIVPQNIFYSNGLLFHHNCGQWQYNTIYRQHWSPGPRNLFNLKKTLCPLSVSKIQHNFYTVDIVLRQNRVPNLLFLFYRFSSSCSSLFSFIPTFCHSI